MDIAEIRKQKKLPQKTVYLPMDPTLHDRLEELRSQLKKQQAADMLTNERDKAPLIEAEVKALEAEMAENSAVFVLQALPRADFRALLAEFPPTEEDLEEELDFDAEGIFAPLLAACCVDPEMELSDAEAIQAGWSDSEVTLLFAAAFTVNKEIRKIPKVR